MKELSKSITRRLRDSRFQRYYFAGDGIDIGGKPDPLTLYRQFFVRMGSVLVWDWEDGDAQLLASVGNESFDFVHASHCLEHMEDPFEALRNWVRVLKPGGYLVMIVPDEDLYEQGQFPSAYNNDHKWTMTIHKATSWSPKSINVTDLATDVSDSCSIVKIELLDETYRYGFPRFDQTLTPVTESGIEMILYKRINRERDSYQVERPSEQPTAEDRKHFNQYIRDYRATRASTEANPPFTDDSEL